MQRRFRRNLFGHTRTHLNVQQLPGAPAGFAGSRVLLNYVDDAGVIIGSYNLLQQGVPARAFIYEPGKGFRHLDQAVDIDIATEGFTRFVDPRFATPTGFIAGAPALVEDPVSARRNFLFRR